MPHITATRWWVTSRRLCPETAFWILNFRLFFPQSHKTMRRSSVLKTCLRSGGPTSRVFIFFLWRMLFATKGERSRSGAPLSGGRRRNQAFSNKSSCRDEIYFSTFVFGASWFCFCFSFPGWGPSVDRVTLIQTRRLDPLIFGNVPSHHKADKLERVSSLFLWPFILF